MTRIPGRLKDYARVGEAIKEIPKPEGKTLRNLEDLLGKALDPTALVDGSLSERHWRKASDVLYAARALRLALEAWADPEETGAPRGAGSGPLVLG